jgi:hypothetical protein
MKKMGLPSKAAWMAQGPKEATATPDMKWEKPFIFLFLSRIR